jgi:hypothetical protein
MNEECEFRSHARPGHHALISGCGKWCATFRKLLREAPSSPYVFISRIFAAASANCCIY